MHAFLVSLKPQRRAVLAAVIVLAVGCAIALPRLNARAAAGLNSITVNDVSGKEGSATAPGSLTFTVTVSGVLIGDATVKVHTLDGTATAPEDYTALSSQTLTFTTGSQSKTVTIALKGDDIPELDETFTLELSDATNATITDASGTGTILNDDLTLSIGDATVNEGDSGGPTAHLLVTLSGSANETTTVVYTTQNGTAVAGEDYVAKSNTLTFNPNDTTQQIDIAIINDTIDEDDETFFVVLSSPVGATINHGTGVVTIGDNDTSPLPDVSIAPTTVTEGTDANAVFTLSLSASTQRTVTVTATTSDGTAKAGKDYTSRTNQISFAPKTTSATFTVPILDDTLNEADETFTVTLSAPVAANIASSGGSALGTIKDNDALPTVVISSPTVNEGATATFNVSLSAASGRDVTVHVGTVDGTATGGADYATLADKTLVFPAGSITAQTVDVQTTQDALDEVNETFGLKVLSVDGAAAGPNGVATIVDDDPTPALSINDPSVAEGDSGSASLVFTVTLSAASGQTVSAHYATADGTATIADGDYAAASGTVTFAPGETTKTITVSVVGDTTPENDETLKVTLSAPVGATLAKASGTGTITNDDGTPPPPPMFITTGAGYGAGSHVRVLNNDGSPHTPPDNFFPYPDGPGVRVARGDLDNDGHDEIVVASGPGKAPIIRVFTPAGGFIAETLAYAEGFTGGVFVAVGDVDGDGKNEIITAAGAGGGPHVRTFGLVGSAGNKSLAATDGFFAADPGYTGGLTVAAGDVNNDGTDEIIVGHASSDQPVVSVWNYNPGAKTVHLRSEFLAYGAQFLGGVSVAAGDLDGDGKAEIVTGAGPGGGPHVRVFSGNGAGLPGSAYAYGASFAGGVNVAIGDIDGDGENEIITGAGPGGGPHVRAFDVLMNPLPTSFYAYGADFHGGVYLAAGRA